MEPIEPSPSHIKPYSDLVIRYLLGREATKQLLLDFINAVISRSDRKKITDLTIITPFNMSAYLSGKGSILDIRAKDEDGTTIQIEVQGHGTPSFVQRILYYWAVSYTDQMKEGDPYNKLCPVIMICLVDFTVIKERREFVNRFAILHEKDLEVLLTEDLEIYFVEMPKFREQDIKLKSEIEKWLWFLNNEGKEGVDVRSVLKDSPIFELAHQEYVKFTADDELRMAYFAQQKYERDRISEQDDAEKKGKAEGRVEGLQEALRLLIAQGISESEAREMLKM